MTAYRRCPTCPAGYLRPRQRGSCDSCKATARAKRAKAKRANMTRQQRAELKLARLRRKARIAAAAAKRIRQRLKAAERRYTWNNFIGWDKVVKMPAGLG